MPSILNGTNALWFRKWFEVWFWGQKHCNFRKSALSSQSECKMPSDGKIALRFKWRQTTCNTFFYYYFLNKLLKYQMTNSLLVTPSSCLRNPFFLRNVSGPLCDRSLRPPPTPAAVSSWVKKYFVWGLHKGQEQVSVLLSVELQARQQCQSSPMKKDDLMQFCSRWFNFPTFFFTVFLLGRKLYECCLAYTFSGLFIVALSTSSSTSVCAIITGLFSYKWVKMI